ncbi:hypothetical protein CEXT_616021 [Caerostris extrusa]|uniref:Uncharacterized protein n=1 Tax=Caerostris extrusa TaxID=172846 RepID=A0AAV4SHS9_CAEEX|nr:hypothetical protein CEXT_616021 [Caerostris extrusa]
MTMRFFNYELRYMIKEGQFVDGPFRCRKVSCPAEDTTSPQRSTDSAAPDRKKERKIRKKVRWSALSSAITSARSHAIFSHRRTVKEHKTHCLCRDKDRRVLLWKTVLCF